MRSESHPSPTDRIEGMQFNRPLRALTSWIAVLAILMAALAPTISHALGSKASANWIDICSSVGAKWVQPNAEPTGKAPNPAAAHVFDHCPYCSLHANATGLPPTSVTLALPLVFGDEFPIAFLAAPRTLHAWVSAQPRAPPLFS